MEIEVQPAQDLITFVSMTQPEVESSRTHFEILGLGLEVSSPRKLPCPRLEDSTIFEPLKFRWNTPETCGKSAKTFFWFPQVEIA